MNAQQAAVYRRNFILNFPKAVTPECFCRGVQSEFRLDSR